MVQILTSPGNTTRRAGSLSLALVLLSSASASLAAWILDPGTEVVPTGSYTRLWTATNRATLAAANDVAVDADGNVYTTGFIDDGSSAPANLHIAKHDAAGNLLWEDTYDGGNYDEGIAIALGPSGEVYVVGATYPSGTGAANIVTIRYDADTGVSDFTVTYDSGTGDDLPVGVAAGSGGEVYVTGYTCSLCNGTDSDIVTVQYDGAGAEIWVQTYDNGGDDVPVGLGIVAGSDVAVAGRSDSGSDADYIALRYAAAAVSGDPPVWEQRFDSGANDRATAMAIGTAGEIFITGTSTIVGDRDFNTIAYDADGNSLWTQAQTYRTSFDDVPTAAAVDAGGASLVVAGYVARPGGDRDVTIVKYAIDDPDQTIVMSYDGGGSDTPADVAGDGAGNVYLTGTQGALGAQDVITLRFDSAGVQTDAFVYDSGSDDTANAITLGADNEGLATAHVALRVDRLSATVQNNEFAAIKYAAARPDLEMSFVGGPAVLPTDGMVTIGNTVTNTKDGATGKLADAGAFDITLYLSPVQDPDPATDLIPFASGSGARAVSGLASGDSDAADTTVAVPSAGTLTPGSAGSDYWLVARADAADVITERDETNNLLVSADPVLVVDPAELVPSSVSGPASALAASDITVDYTIENQRGTDAGSFDLAFVLSSDTTVGDADDIALTGTATVNQVAGNDSTSGSAVVGIPNTAPPGDYFIGMIVDTEDDILEADETNNTLTSLATLTVEPIADLVVTAVEGPLGGTAGGTISVSTTVVSNDRGVTQDFSVDIYLSNDTVIDGTDTLLDSRLISEDLTAGTPSTGATTVTIPSGTAQGVYYLGAIADAADQVTESDEGNNVAASAATISIGLPETDANAQPDLVVTAVSGPSEAPAGQSITVSTTVENVLAEPVTTPFKVGIYLSPDPTITSDDVLMGERTISAMPGNSVDSADTVIEVLAEIPDPVTSWTNTNNVTIAGNTVTAANNSIGAPISTSSVDGDGAVETTVVETDTVRAFGLTSFNTVSLVLLGMEYAWILRGDGTYDLYHDGTNVGGGTYATGDVLRIERANGQVLYRQNGQTVATTTVTYTGPAYFDVTFFSGNAGATIADANLVSIILSTGQTYYLGVIVDYEDVVAEVDETNNTRLQTDALGDPEAIPVTGVQLGNASGSSGSGALGVIELLFTALFLLLSWQRRRVPAHGPRAGARPRRH